MHVTTTDQRREISQRFANKHGLPGAVGIVDGTPVTFANRPGIDGEVWFSRKQRYSMNLQLVCDDRGKILYYIVGWPGSVCDNTVLQPPVSTGITARELLFSGGIFACGCRVFADDMP